MGGYNGGAGGRPTKYTPELLKNAWDYLENYSKYEHAFPSDIGLADVIGITTPTLYDWANQPEKHEFSCILDGIQRKQQLVAWNKGLIGEYNANLVKLLLGKHGYSEKQTNDHTSSDGSMRPQVIHIESISTEKE